MISYAQNHEDILLARALKQINKGFYIDVGCAWETNHSVTKYFYDQGWSGINIDSNPLFKPPYIERRHRDKFINVGVSNQNDNLIFYSIGATGLSTFNSDFASAYDEEKYEKKAYKVDVKTLQEIWSQNVPEGQDVHFLKIDVEGYEEKVLEGNDWQNNRPWIIVFEATIPLKKEKNSGGSDKILTQNNYIFAFDDGLNHFYVAAEKSELLESFKVPYNIFDNFLPHATLILQNQTSELTKINQEIIEFFNKTKSEYDTRINENNLDINQYKMRVAKYEMSLKEYEAHTSMLENRSLLKWNMIYAWNFLRRVKRKMRAIISKKSFLIKVAVVKILVFVYRLVIKVSFLRSFAQKIACYFPAGRSKMSHTISATEEIQFRESNAHTFVDSVWKQLKKVLDKDENPI